MRITYYEFPKDMNVRDVALAKRLNDASEN